MIDVKEIGKRLREVRGDMSQIECAAKLGISRAALSYYENGSRAIDTSVLCEFCKRFGVSADYILGLSEARATSEDIKTACKVSHLPESSIESLKAIADKICLGDTEKEDLTYIIESKQFKDIVTLFARTRQLQKFLYSDKYSSSEETINAYLDEIGLEKVGRVGALMMDFITNGGIEPIFKHTLSEKAAKLFDEYKEHILSRPHCIYGVCLYPKNSGGYTVTVPDLHGCIAEGEDIREALENAERAAIAWIKEELGGAVPEPTPLDEVKADEYENGFTRQITIYTV